MSAAVVVEGAMGLEVAAWEAADPDEAADDAGIIAAAGVALGVAADPAAIGVAAGVIADAGGEPARRP